MRVIMWPFLSPFKLSNDTGPCLRNECTRENWAYGHFHTKLSIQQCGHERMLTMIKSHIKSHIVYASFQVSAYMQCSTVQYTLAEWRNVIRPNILTEI